MALADPGPYKSDSDPVQKELIVEPRPFEESIVRELREGKLSMDEDDYMVLADLTLATQLNFNHDTIHEAWQTVLYLLDNGHTHNAHPIRGNERLTLLAVLKHITDEKRRVQLEEADRKTRIRRSLEALIETVRGFEEVVGVKRNP